MRRPQDQNLRNVRSHLPWRQVDTDHHVLTDQIALGDERVLTNRRSFPQMAYVELHDAAWRLCPFRHGGGEDLCHTHVYVLELAERNLGFAGSCYSLHRYS